MSDYLKNKIKKNIVQGIWSVIPNNVVTEIFSLSGLDFLILDMEHGSFSKEDIKNSIIVCNLHKCAVFVRIPIFDLSNIQSALDSGCSGIVFPKISSKQEAMKAVSMCEFSPKGCRGFNPFTRFNNYNLFKKDFYKNHESLLKIVIIETKEGIENLEDILLIEEIDVVYLGTYDLSKEYNFKSVNNKRFLNIIDRSLAKINLSGKIPGLMINNINYINLAKKYKSNFLVHSVDTQIIGNATKNILKFIK